MTKLDTIAVPVTFRDHKTTPLGALILALRHLHPGISTRDLADELGVQRRSITETIDRLRALGYLDESGQPKNLRLARPKPHVTQHFVYQAVPCILIGWVSPAAAIAWALARRWEKRTSQPIPVHELGHDVKRPTVVIQELQKCGLMDGSGWTLERPILERLLAMSKTPPVEQGLDELREKINRQVQVPIAAPTTTQKTAALSPTEPQTPVVRNASTVPQPNANAAALNGLLDPFRSDLAATNNPLLVPPPPADRAHWGEYLQQACQAAGVRITDPLSVVADKQGCSEEELSAETIHAFAAAFELHTTTISRADQVFRTRHENSKLRNSIGDRPKLHWFAGQFALNIGSGLASIRFSNVTSHAAGLAACPPNTDWAEHMLPGPLGAKLREPLIAWKQSSEEAREAERIAREKKYAEESQPILPSLMGREVAAAPPAGENRTVEDLDPKKADPVGREAPQARAKQITDQEAAALVARAAQLTEQLKADVPPEKLSDVLAEADAVTQEMQASSETITKLGSSSALVFVGLQMAKIGARSPARRPSAAGSPVTPAAPLDRDSHLPDGLQGRVAHDTAPGAPSSEQLST